MQGAVGFFKYQLNYKFINESSSDLKKIRSDSTEAMSL